MSVRPFTRRASPARHSSSTSGLTWLISLIAGAFLLQNIFLRWFNADAVLDHALALSVANVEAFKLWTPVTYSFLHSTDNFPYLLHIVGNLLCLYFLGRELRPITGERQLIGLYFASVMLGAGVWTGIHWNTGGLLTGATAGVCGLFAAFACFYPQRQITFLLFFIFPVTFKPRSLLLAVAALELTGTLFYEVLGYTSPFDIAHSAHLGGLLAGWAYFRFFHRGSLPGAARRVSTPPFEEISAEVDPDLPIPAPTTAADKKADLRAEVDRILDKINSQGFAALTAAEKRVLAEAKNLLNRR